MKNISEEIKLPSINKVDDKQIIELLNYCGIKHSYEGYLYIFAFIRYSIDHFGEKKGTVKTYEEIGKRFNKTKTAIERCIRNAVKNSNMPKMTNRGFITEAVGSLVFGTDIKNFKE